MHLFELYEHFKTNENAIHFLRVHGILRSVKPLCPLPSCQKEMEQTKAGDGDHWRLDDGFIWLCPDPSHQEKKLSIRNGSILANTNLAARNFVLLAYLWAIKAPLQFQAFQCGLNRRAIVAWNKFFHKKNFRNDPFCKVLIRDSERKRSTFRSKIKMPKRRKNSVADEHDAHNIDSSAAATSEQPAVKIAPIFAKPAERKLHGTWKVIPEQLLIYTCEGVENRSKIAGFDLDATLIKTKSNRVFPTDANDWQLWSKEVVKMLKKMYEDGFKLCIFTNQKGIQAKHVDIGHYKRKIQFICSAINLPMQVFVSVGSLNYRKPYIGMWLRLEMDENGGVPVDRSNSFYVGDAAGRVKSEVRKKADHSCVDRLLAMNLSIKFYTPEQFFLGDKTEEPYRLPELDPSELLARAAKGDKIVLFDPPTAKIPGPSQPELLVLVGPPASGKSTFARRYCEPENYAVLSQDQLGSWKACLKEAEKLIRDGRSVVIDNTNRDRATRSRYRELAASLSVPCRCFVLDCSPAIAQHNNIVRQIMGTDLPHIKVDEIAIRTFFSAYQGPKLEEGFEEVVQVEFVPEFENEEHRRIYGMWLTKK